MKKYFKTLFLIKDTIEEFPHKKDEILEKFFIPYLKNIFNYDLLLFLEKSGRYAKVKDDRFILHFIYKHKEKNIIIYGSVSSLGRFHYVFDFNSDKRFKNFIYTSFNNLITFEELIIILEKIK